MKRLMVLAVAVSSLFSADSFETLFSEGEVSGYVRYYYIETVKENPNSSAHANSIGGVLTYETGNWNGFSSGATFMTTNGFFLPNKVDTSILGRDNGVRLGTGAGGEDAQDSFSVLGEAYIRYEHEDFSALIGRQVIRTPLADAKEVRMLPSSFEGGFLSYKPSDFTVELACLTRFKQRTSDRFINILEHALGSNTEAVTGSSSGSMAMFHAGYDNKTLALNLYDYYTNDFMNSLYLDASYKGVIDGVIKYHVSGQYINQMSVGQADDNLALGGSLTGGKTISTNSVSVKAGLGFKYINLDIAFSRVNDNDEHDGLVLAYDGTPLYTNMITSNDLFQSNYGQAFNSDSIYIGGSEGVKLAYTQKYDFTGVEGIKTILSYLHVSNEDFVKSQNDINAVIAYTQGQFSLAGKAIYVTNNTSADATGVISQIDSLRQFRVIANYKF